MDHLARIAAFKVANSVASGPEAAHYVALGIKYKNEPGRPDVPFPARPNGLKPGEAALEQLSFALSLTVTGMALRLSRRSAFDLLFVHAPVMRARMPYPATRDEAIRGVVLQQAQHFAAACMSMVGAAMLLAQLRPEAAYRMVVPEDGQTCMYNIVCLEFLLGLPVYVCVMMLEMGFAAARPRVLGQRLAAGHVR